MPNKTITLEIDAYEKLRAAKRGGESFTEVVRRAVIPDAAPTGKTLREHYRRGGGKVSDEYLDAVERAASHDPIPDDPWA
jgi:hypothetical protein